MLFENRRSALMIYAKVDAQGKDALRAEMKSTTGGEGHSTAMLLAMELRQATRAVMRP